MNLLSIQSHVAYGHVGNSAAVFPLQRMGVEVWPVHTVQFSNHPGYGDFRGRALPADLIRETVSGIAARGVFGECDGLLSGYMGHADTGAVILDALATIRASNPAARYCCDPVIGDIHEGVYAQTGVPEFMKERAVPAADIITPNHFELNYLSGRETTRLADVRKAVKALHALGPRTVLVTSLHIEETPGDAIDMLVSDDSGLYLLRTPKLPITANGSGDVVAALFFAHYLRAGDAAAALSAAGSAMFGVLRKTVEMGTREIQIVAAQEEIVNPSRVFAGEALSL